MWYPKIVASAEKILAQARNNPKGLRFSELQRLAKALGYELSRVNGSHHIYTHPTRPELPQLNMQEDKGMAKAYQVRQVLSVIDEFELEV